MTRGDLVGAVIKQVDATHQAVEPLEEVVDGRLAHDGRAVLRNHHGDVELPRHARPQAQDLVGDHVAAVNAFHAWNVRCQMGHRHARVGARGHGDAQVAREQDAADRVVEVEVAFGMHEMRGQQHQLVPAQRQAAAAVGHPDDAVLGFAELGEVRREALPDA